MIHCIQPHRYDISFRHKEPQPDDFVFVAQQDTVLLADDGDGFLPAYGSLHDAYPEVRGNVLFLFSIDDENYFLLDRGLAEAPGFAYRASGSFRTMQPRLRAFAGITAAHPAGWYARMRFCGACGRPMVHKGDERAMLCPECNLILYPSISPAVIVGVTDGDRLLLTRYANRPTSRNYALIAGFMEAGESLEDTVRREVMEETGIRVKNIRYYKSQPWGFSSSMLAGFYADLDGSPELTVDGVELAEAVWLLRNEITPPDVGVALTAEMIDAFRRGEYPR